MPSPAFDSPVRGSERYGGGFERGFAFDGLSRPCEALVAFELVAAAMCFLQVAKIRRAAAATDRNDLVHFGAHRVRPFDRVVYRSAANAARRLLCEYPLSCEIAGLPVDAPGVFVVSAVGHGDSPSCWRAP